MEKAYRSIISIFLCLLLGTNSTDSIYLKPATAQTVFHAEFSHSSDKHTGNSFEKIVLKGMTKSRTYTGNGDLVIFLFRDLHAQEEAQMSIAQAIENLTDKVGLSQVFMEGADGPVRTLLYQAFPDEKLREQISREFLKEGILTGAEYAAIKTGIGGGIRLFGVEDARIYVEDFKSFRQVRKVYELLKKDLIQMEVWIGGLKERMYSDVMKKLDWILDFLDGKKTGMQKAISEIELVLKKRKEIMGLTEDPLEGYERIRNIKDLMRLSSLMDQEKLEREHHELNTDFEHRLVKEDLRKIITISLQYRLGRITESNYLESLKENYEKILSLECPFEEKYPQLELWRKVSLIQESVHVEEVFEELGQITHQLKKEFAGREGLKELSDLDAQFRKLSKLIRLELSRNDLENLYKFYYGNPPSSSEIIQRFFSGIKRLKEKQADAAPVPMIHKERFTELIGKALTFYRLAEARDGIMVSRMLDNLPGKRLGGTGFDPRFVVLITGGFHTEGIQRLLKKNKVSYVTWTPEIKKEIQGNLYEKIMLDENYDFDRIDFSPKRFALRSRRNSVVRMLSPPVLLNEILGSLSTKFDRNRISLLKKMIHGMRDMGSVNAVLNTWMAGKGNISILQSLKPNDFALLFEALDREKVYVNLPELNPSNKTQALLTIETVRAAYAEKFPALLKLTQAYFSKIPGSSSSGLQSIFYEYEQARKSRGFFGKIVSWLGEPRFIAPFWEETVFRLIPIGLVGITLGSIGAMSPLALGMVFGISLGLYPAAPVFARWVAERDKPVGERTYQDFKSVLKGFFRFLIPSGMFTMAYLYIYSFTFPYIHSTAPFLAFGVSFFIHSFYNRLVMIWRKRKPATEKHLSENEIRQVMKDELKAGRVLAFSDVDLEYFSDNKFNISADELIERVEVNLQGMEGEEFDSSEALSNHLVKILILAPDSKRNLARLLSYIKILHRTAGDRTDQHRYMIPLGSDDIFTHISFLDLIELREPATQTNEHGQKNTVPIKTVFLSEKLLIAGMKDPAGLKTLILHRKKDLAEGGHRWREGEEKKINRFLRLAKRVRIGATSFRTFLSFFFSEHAVFTAALALGLIYVSSVFTAPFQLLSPTSGDPVKGLAIGMALELLFKTMGIGLLMIITWKGIQAVLKKSFITVRRIVKSGMLFFLVIGTVLYHAHILPILPHIISGQGPVIIGEGYSRETNKFNEKVRLVREGFQRLPPHQQNIVREFMPGVVFVKDGVLFGTGSFIPFLDEITLDGPRSSSGGVSHEFGHLMYFRLLTAEEREEFAELTRQSGTERKHFASSYAMTNVLEDFADGFEAWMKNSLELLNSAEKSELLGNKVLIIARQFVFTRDQKTYLRVYRNGIPTDIELTGQTRSIEDLPALKRITSGQVARLDRHNHIGLEIFPALLPSGKEVPSWVTEGIRTGLDKIRKDHLDWYQKLQNVKITLGTSEGGLEVTFRIQGKDVPSEQVSFPAKEMNTEKFSEAAYRQVEKMFATPTQKLPVQPTVPGHNLALTPEGTVAGRTGITNSEVGIQVKERFDRAGLSSGETHLTGEVLSFRVGELTEKLQGMKLDGMPVNDVPEKLAAFLESDIYTSLEKETRDAFEETRFVIFPGRLSVAENDKGTSYAHYGEAFGSTVFMGGNLIEYLLQNDPESLAVIIRLEMNRKKYRKIHDKDPRSSIEVVRREFEFLDGTFNGELLDRLETSIARAEAEALLAKWGDKRIAQVIVLAAQALDEKVEQSALVDDAVLLKRLRGKVIAAVTEKLAGRMKGKEKEEEKARRIETVVEKIQKTRISAEEQVLLDDLNSVLGAEQDAEVIRIDPFSGKIIVYMGQGKSKSIKIREEGVRTLRRMIGKRTGSVKKIIIDLKRAVRFDERFEVIRKSVALLLEGTPVKFGKHERFDTLSLEHLNLGGDPVIHISRGTPGISELNEEAIVAFEFFEQAFVKGNNPVVLETGILRSMLKTKGEEELRRFVRKYGKRIAVKRDDKIEGLTSEEHNPLWANWDRFQNMKNNNKVAVVSEDREISDEMKGASILRISKKQIEGLPYVTRLAAYIADLGKKEARTSTIANNMFRELLIALYEKEIPPEYRNKFPLQQILDNPEGFLFPPVDIKKVTDIESYFRARRVLEVMA